MNHTNLQSNEFILQVNISDEDILYTLLNPHTDANADGRYDKLAWTAAHGLLAMAKIKLKRKKPKNDDESDPELHGG